MAYLSIGDSFEDFASLERAVKFQEECEGVKYWKRDSRLLESAKKRNLGWANPNPNLKYGELKYACTKGGRNKKSPLPSHEPCNASICFRASNDGQRLVVMTLTGHNHPGNEKEVRVKTEKSGKVKRKHKHRSTVYTTSKKMSKKVIPDQEQILLEPYEYIQQIPGKNVRTKLAAAFNHWLKVPQEKLEIISEITQMLHNASLLIDDIEDNSKLRRGIPVAHNIYGVAHTINSANYVYFLGLEKVLTLNKPEAMAVFTEQLLELHQGQGLDIHWRDAYVCPSEDEYKAMVIKKTGGLFGLAVRLMQLFSENKSNFKPLLDNLGLYFQIRDDFANLYSKEYQANKSYCEDLTEGKFSFPLIHGIHANPRDNQIMSILRQRTTDNDVKKYCVEYLHKVGSFEYTRKIIIELEQILLDQIADYDGNPYLESLISELSKLYRQEDEESISSTMINL